MVLLRREGQHGALGQDAAADDVVDVFFFLRHDIESVSTQTAERGQIGLILQIGSRGGLGELCHAGTGGQHKAASRSCSATHDGGEQVVLCEHGGIAINDGCVDR